MVRNVITYTKNAFIPYFLQLYAEVYSDFVPHELPAT